MIEATTPVSAPRWALLERQLLETQARAIEEFHARYFDERGYLLCVPRWSGDDGPDDALENVLNWTVLHALGAGDRVLALYKHALEGHFRQYTEAKTTEVELGREGMYYQEFHACFDWFHHGEAWSPVFLQGLTDPGDGRLTHRFRRWSSWYMGDDPHIPNYDKEHKVIRSFFNGSRGPLLRKATALDWAGDPIQVEGRFDAAHRETNFQEMLDHFRDYTDVVGDSHLNLGATTLGLTAYALTGEQKYRDWVLEYLDAWAERTRQNDGLIPTSIGLDGTIESGYGWYGGVYGWGFTVMVIPWEGKVDHRGGHRRTPFAFANALLLTGDRSYVDLFRRTIDRVNENAKQEGGQTLYPHMYGRLDRFERLQRGESIDDLPETGPEGWYDYRPQKYAPSAEALWYWTMDRSNLELLGHTPRWVKYLDGDDPTYPEAALLTDLEAVRRKVQGMRNDPHSPDTTMSDNPNYFNPATTDALIRLMLGGIPTGRDVHVLHCRLRYFDPARRRAGLPEHVAALVDHMTEDEVGVQLVNLDPVETRTVIVQAGAYAEHSFTHVRSEGEAPVDLEVTGSHVAVKLAPGCGLRLALGMRRFANQPTFAFPWP